MKERLPFVSIELRENTKLEWNKNLNRLEVLDTEGNISVKNLVAVGQCYPRDGKNPKILRQLTNPSGGIVDFSEPIKNYDRFFAVDTSYVPFGNNYLCATGSLFLVDKVDPSGSLKKGDNLNLFSPPRLIFLSKNGRNPERYGWMKVIEGMMQHELFEDNLSHGMIVDSDLKDIAKINSGELPLNDVFFLPKNISLLYASADVGKDVLINKLMRAADGIAKQSLKIAQEIYVGQESFQFDPDFWDVNQISGVPDISL